MFIEDEVKEHGVVVIALDKEPGDSQSNLHLTTKLTSDLGPITFS